MILTKEPGNTRLFYFLSLALVLASTYWLWDFLRLFDDPSGANGYFYLKQTESLAAGLGFYFKDYSLAFAVPVAFMKMTGDSLLSFQLSVVLTWALLCLGVRSLTANVTGTKNLNKSAAFAFLAILGLVCTTQVYELTMTYFKNVFALMIFIFGLACFFNPKRTSLQWILCALFFAIALLSHKSMLLLIAFFGISWLMQNISAKKLILAMASGIVIAAIFLWQFEKAAAYLGHLLNVFSTPERWLNWFTRLNSRNLEMVVTAYSLGAIAIFYLFRRKYLSMSQQIFGDGVFLTVLAAILPFQNPGANGPSYRILLLAPALALPLLLMTIASIKTRLVVLLGLALVLLTPFTIQPFLGSRHLDDVFTPWNVTRDDVLKISQVVNREDHLTSHHGFEFFIDDVTGIRSRSFLSTDSSKKNYRVAFVSRLWLPDPDSQRLLRAKSLLEIGSEYILMTEADWQELTKLLKIPHHWKNPDEVRPDYIYE